MARPQVILCRPMRVRAGERLSASFETALDWTRFGRHHHFSDGIASTSAANPLFQRSSAPYSCRIGPVLHH